MKKLNQPFLNLAETVTEEHIGFFRQHGVVHFKNFIPRQTVNDFIAEIKSVEAFY